MPNRTSHSCPMQLSQLTPSLLEMRLCGSILFGLLFIALPARWDENNVDKEVDDIVDVTMMRTMEEEE